MSDSRIKNKVARYCWNWLVMGSQILSVLLGGHPDESLCQRIAWAYITHKGTNTRKELIFTIAKRCINAPFKLLGQEDHVMDSIAGEPWAGTVWDWEK
jgi:hypothetical protein